MLIRFRVANFLSFKEEAELSMLSGNSRQHPSHKISGGNSRYVKDLLRASVIYGANASGKSNLIQSLSFMQDLVIHGTETNQNIPISPFKLDPSCINAPAKFEVEIRSNSVDYLYGFEATYHHIVSEWLYQLRLTSQTMIYERVTSPEGVVTVEFGRESKLLSKDREFLGFIARSTRRNQLFLTECADKNVSYYAPVYQWFANDLHIILPDSRFRLSSGKTNLAVLASYLEKFDTGICGIELRPAQFDDRSPKEFYSALRKVLEKRASEHSPVDVVISTGERFVAAFNNGEYEINELVFTHKSVDCKNDVIFELNEESDGSVRLLDFIPMLIPDRDTEPVFVVDEFDRSLHPSLCYSLLQLFLQNTDMKAQFIATTHESNLLDLSLLRRDEIWFIEKNKNGASKVYSLEEFTPRYDKDIQKGYLQGRFGAIPFLGRFHFGKGNKDA